MRRKGYLLLAVLTLCMLDVTAQTNPDIRLALVSSEPALRPAMDLLTVELSRYEKIILLERTEIERVLREQSLSAGGRDWLKLGQMLGADGLLIAETTGEGADQRIGLRLVAVKPGVVLGSLRSPWPVANVGEWTKGIPIHFAPLFPKLNVLAKDAVPISVVNLRAAVSSRETRELEQQLTVLTIERLTRERELFVLERRRMELLSAEKELMSTDDSAFWNGSYLLDGVIDRDGYSKERVTLHARLVPPNGGIPLELAVEGARTNVAGVVEQLTVKMLATLKRGSTATAWQPEAEAQKYFEEAKWAVRWSMFRQAQAAADSAWALGLRNAAIAELRVRAWRETGLDREGCYLDAEKGWITFTGPPDAAGFTDLLRAAEIYESGWFAYKAGEGKLDRRWFELGCSLIEDHSNWLRHYYFVVEARAGSEEKIAAGRRLASAIFTALTQHPDYATSDRERILLSIAAHGQAFWQETPGEGLAFHRRVMDSGQWPWVRRRFITVGQFPSENGVSGNLGSSPYSDLASPPLTGWNWSDRKNWPMLWQGYIDELCASSNSLLRLEGSFLRCSFAWSGDEYERALGEVLNVASSHQNEIFRAGIQTNLIADLKVLAGAERLGGAPFITTRADRLTPERLGRIREKLWLAFETEFTRSMMEVAGNLEFEKVKDYLRTRNEFDFSSFSPFTSRDYDAEQANELLPLLAAFRARLWGDTNQAETSQLKMRRHNVGYWTGQLEAKLKAKLAPPATNTTPLAPAAGPKPPTSTPLPKNPASPEVAPRSSLPGRTPSAPLAQLLTPRFWSAQSAGIKLKNPLNISVMDVCWREDRLWVQLNYVELDNATGAREEQCVVAIIEPDSFATQLVSFRDQIPFNEGGYFQVPIRSRVFEVLRNHLFVSTGDGLKKCSLPDRKWEDLNVPVSGQVRLQRVNDRVLITTADSILELNPDGSGVRILASNRRQPPLTILDRMESYGAPQVFSLGRGDCKTYLHGKIYSLNPGSADWVMVGAGPPGPGWIPSIADDGLFLQRSVPAGRGELWGMFGGKESLELLVAQQTQRPSPGIGMSPVASANDSTNRPKWDLTAGRASFGGPVCADGTNLWILGGTLALELKEGRAVVKEQPGGNMLSYFASDAAEAFVIPVRLDVPGDALPPLSLRHLVSQGNLGERVFRATPNGLVLARSGLPGFWLIPRAELKKRIEKR